MRVSHSAAAAMTLALVLVGQSQAQSYPNDPDYYLQWSLQPNAAGSIHASQAWSLSTGSARVKVGFIGDTADQNHSDLRISYEGVWPTDAGTAVAGVWGARTNNGIGIAGIDNLSIGYFKPGGYTSSDLISSAVAAVSDFRQSGYQVIYVSWSQPNSTVEALRLPLLDAYRAGITVIAPCATLLDHDGPAGWFPGIIAVAGTRLTGLARLDAVGLPYVDFGAPSSDPSDTYKVYSTKVGSGYGYSEGMHLAGAHVAGVVSLLLAANPQLRNYDVEQLLKRTASTFPTWSTTLGHGLIDAGAALKAAVGPNVIRAEGTTLTQTAANATVLFTCDPVPGNDAFNAGTYICDKYELRGNVSFDAPFVTAPETWMGVGSGLAPGSCAVLQGPTATVNGAGVECDYFYLRTTAAGNGVFAWYPADPTLAPAGFTVYGKQVGFHALGDPVMDAVGRFRGCSIADVNGDQWPDVFVADQLGNNRLLMNQLGTHLEASPQSLGSLGSSGIWGDYDNDGDRDLYVTSDDVSNQLYKNDAGGV